MWFEVPRSNVERNLTLFYFFRLLWTWKSKFILQLEHYFLSKSDFYCVEQALLFWSSYKIVMMCVRKFAPNPGTVCLQACTTYHELSLLHTLVPSITCNVRYYFVNVRVEGISVFLQNIMMFSTVKKIRELSTDKAKICSIRHILELGYFQGG